MADVQSLLRGITYDNTSQNPTTGNRTLDIEVQDVAGLISDTAISTINVNAQNDAPTASNNTVTTNEDTAYTFDKTDFNFSDIDGDTLVSVKVTTLEIAGALQLSGVDVTLNQVITKADINAGNLKFVPVANASGTSYDSFDFTVNDGTADSASSYTLTIDVTAVNDDPTNAGSLPSDIVVSEDVSSNVDLSAIDLSDIDAGGSLTVTLTTSTGGNLSAAAGTGITIGGTSTARTLTGTLTDLNNYLNTASNITYLHGTPDTNGNDADTIQVNVNDN
ncbi:MAG: hypothetical protein GY783_13415, partial [Gammaproteobacteria bacterium]|nr:hypothetical protein [Gammaproteobacteria bacterium]